MAIVDHVTEADLLVLLMEDTAKRIDAMPTPQLGSTLLKYINGYLRMKGIASYSSMEPYLDAAAKAFLS